MRRLLILLSLALLPSAAWAYTETFYACATGDGSAPEDATCAHAWDAADFNTAGNWDTDDANDGKLGPNDLLIILDDGGVYRATLTVQQPGLAGKPITIQGEDGGDATISGANLVTGWTSNAGSVGGPTGDLDLNDNFDDNDITDWEAAAGTVAAGSGVVTVTMTGGGADRIRRLSLTSRTEVWASFDFTLQSGYAGLASGERFQGSGPTHSSFKTLAYVGLWADAEADPLFELVYADDAASNTYTASSIVMTPDVAQHVVVHWKAATAPGANDGVAQFWVDGVLGVSVTNIDNDTLASDAFVLGNVNASTFDMVIKVDNVKRSLTGSAPVAGVADTWKAASAETSQVYFNDVRGTGVASVALCNGARKWYWAADILYVYSTADPTTAYVLPGVEASVRYFTIYISGKDYATVSDLHLIRSRSYTFGSAYAENSIATIFDELTVNDNDAYAGIMLNGTGAGKRVTNCTIYNTRYASDDRGSGIWVDGADGSHLIENNTIYNNTGVGIQLGVNTATSSNTIRDNTIYGHYSSGIAVAPSCASNVIEYNTVYENTASVADRYEIDLYQAGNNNIVRYNVVHDGIYTATDAGGIRFDADVAGTFGSGTLCYYNLVYNERNGIYNLNADGVAIYNNDVYNSGVSAIVLHGADADANLVKNNIINTAGTNLIYNRDATNSVIDYNVFFPTTGTKFNWNDTAYNFADWKTNSSQDAHSVNADPLFISASDFHLQDTSPAQGKGVNVSLTSDYAGTRVQGVPDIGAYETLGTRFPVTAVTITTASNVTRFDNRH